MKVLRLVRQIGPISASYHHFTLPLLDEHHVTLCAYQPTAAAVDCRIDNRSGDGTLGSFLRVLASALRDRTFDVVHVHDVRLALLWLIVAAVVRPSLLRRSVMHLHRSFPAYSGASGGPCRPRCSSVDAWYAAAIRRATACRWSTGCWPAAG